ncbi:MAG: hypothetical protein ABSB52_16600 [Acidimicrobiales bacterium]|jgi:hypothetical protein
MRRVQQEEVSWVTQGLHNGHAIRFGSFLPAGFAEYLRASTTMPRPKIALIQVHEWLARSLQDYTTTAKDCVFLFSSSWGSLLPDLEDPTHIRFDGMECLGVAGDLMQIEEFSVAPTLFWPKDRAWLVVCVLDTDVALAACERQPAEILLADQTFDIRRVSREELFE